MFQARDSPSGEQLLGKTQRILLESITVLYFLAKSSSVPLVQQYVYHLVDLKHGYTDQKDTILHGNQSQHEHNRHVDSLQHKVSKESSQIILYLNVAELLPSAIVVLFLGCYSDYIGRRKFLLWLPCFGGALLALGYLIPLYACNSDIDHPATKALLVAASIASGLSGQLPGFLSGNASYISDTDTLQRRTLRLAVVELTVGMTFGLANFCNGIWISHTDSFHLPLWFVFGASLLAGLLVMFGLKEPSGELSYTLGKHSSISWRDVKGIKHLFTLGTISMKRLWAMFVAFQIYIFVQQGQERTFVMFLRSDPLDWSAVEIGTFFLVLYGLSGLASWPGVPLMKLFIGDVSITLLALISKAMGSFIMAFATDYVTVFLACAVQLFHLMPYATVRSILSKQVGEDEQGAVYALTHSVQSVFGFLGPLFHNFIFSRTLKQMSGLVFLVSGPLLAIPFALLLYTAYLDRRQSGYGYMDNQTASPDDTTPMSENIAFAKSKETFGATVELSTESDTKTKSN